MDEAVNGLRGIAAFHVMLFHYTWIVYQVSVYGMMEVPVFYLLSGFSLALAYGNKKLDLLSFYYKRLVRVLPLYWLVNFFSALPIQNGSPATWPYADARFWMTLTCTNTWMCPLFFQNCGAVSPYSLPSWFITTIIFFYLVFPFIISPLKKLSDEMISRLIVIIYWFQLLPFFLVWYTSEDYKNVSVAIAWNPLSRLPVFILGILGGLQTLRWRLQNTRSIEEKVVEKAGFNFWIFRIRSQVDLSSIDEEKAGSDFSDPNENRSIVHILFPYGFTSKIENTILSQESSEMVWSRRADISLTILSLFLVAATLKLHSFVNFNNEAVIIFCHLGLIHVQLILIIGVSRDAGRSMASRLFRSRIPQALFPIGTSLYLVHEECERWHRYLQLHTRIPDILVYKIVVAMVIAWLIHKLYEVPVSKLLLRVIKKK